MSKFSFSLPGNPQALNEDAAVLKSVLAKEGSNLIGFLQRDYFPSLPLGPEPAQVSLKTMFPLDYNLGPPGPYKLQREESLRVEP